MGINSLSDGLFLFSHFMNPRVMLLFGFTLSFPHRSFPCTVVRPCIINRDSKSSVFNSCVTSSRVSSLFISWSYLVDFLPCYFMAFCSDLASFPQSKQEGNHVEECVHGTGFCDCGAVGESGPGVDGVQARWCDVQGGKAGAALVCTALLRPAVCKTPCVSFCSPLCFVAM